MPLYGTTLGKPPLRAQNYKFLCKNAINQPYFSYHKSGTGLYFLMGNSPVIAP